MDELAEMKKELADLRFQVSHMRERWDFFEETWMSAIIEFCKEWHIATPEEVLKEMEKRSLV